MLVPPDNRWKNPMTEEWEVNQSYAQEVKDLAERYFKIEETEKKYGEVPSLPSPETPIDVLMSVFEMVTPAMRDKLYLSMSKVFHPDAGGTNELMKNLNNVYDKVKGKK